MKQDKVRRARGKLDKKEALEETESEATARNQKSVSHLGFPLNDA